MIFLTTTAEGTNSSTGLKLEINLYFVSLGSFSHVVYEPNRGKDQAGINNSTLSLLKLNSESSRDLKMPWTKTEKS